MQGFNMGRYYPPSTTTAPTFNKTHPLGARAHKSSQGILTVRFEMPFAIWCGTCPKPTIIGQGVRFNAEKKKVGNYHSTPIWAFRMKHAACGGWIEIRTDPAASEYVVVEGATRRDYGDAGLEEGILGEVLSMEEKERRRNDAFAAFEGKKSEKEKAKGEEDRVLELKMLRERDWDDPYAANKRLRQEFRKGRKVREGQAREAEALQDKYSVGFELVEEDESDRLRASAIEYGMLGRDDNSVSKAVGKPLFESKSTGTPQSTTGKTKSEIQHDSMRSNLQKNIMGNTRASMNPFDSESNRTSDGASKSLLAGIKRKKPSHEVDKKPTLPALVDYDSD